MLFYGLNVNINLLALILVRQKLCVKELSYDSQLYNVIQIKYIELYSD